MLWWCIFKQQIPLCGMNMVSVHGGRGSGAGDQGPGIRGRRRFHNRLQHIRSPKDDCLFLFPDHWTLWTVTKYVHAHPQATLYHLSAWKNVIEKTYGTKPIILKPEGITQSTQQTVNYKYSSLAILYMAFISYLSSIPGGSFPGNGSLTEQTISNLAHIPEYGLLTFLWLKAFVRRGNTDTVTVHRGQWSGNRKRI